jgi:ubiquinone/menaquinone biosynthesis C-methylase UbiE
MENNDIVLEYYEKYEQENERLINEPLELIRTKEIISRFLPEKPIKIIDLCGASGHYSYWLAQKGHEVHLMDLSERHIKQAKNNETKYNVQLASIGRGDARTVKWEDETFDMVLLMGALYHLQEKEERLQCLKEVYRILKNGGTAVFAYICRYASMLDGFLRGFVNDPMFLKIMDDDILTGRHNNPKNKEHYFTNAYFHSTEDIYNELINTKYCDIMLYAVEGFGGLINNEEYLKDNEKRKKLLHYIKLTEQNMEMIGISPHQLVICKKYI